MTNQKRRDEANAKPGSTPEAGYRGSLPPRNDALARPWVVIVIAGFVLILALSFAGLPSSLIPTPTPLPSPTATPTATATASPSGSASASALASASASASAPASVSPSPTP